MRHLLHGLLFFLFLANPAVAQISDPYTSITKDELRKAIYAGEVRKVETAFRAAQAKFLRGEANIDDLRWLNEVFTTTHPDVISFTEAWLRRYPNSPYAHTAQAWINYKIGWIIRGEGIARKIYPDALTEFSRLHRDAWDHALEAYEADPRYIPASDALMRLANSTHNQIKAYRVLHQAMQDNPDWGNLRRAVDTVQPGWGGTWEIAVRMCEQYGPMIDSDIDMVLYCKAYADLQYFGKNHGEWTRDIIRDNHFTNLDDLRLFYSTSYHATRAEAAFTYNYLTREGVTNSKYAIKFDRYIALKYGYDFISEAHQRRARDNARKALEDDPYDPDLIKTMQKGIIRFSLSEGGGAKSTLIERLSREEEIEYARRLLIIAPYDPRYYSGYIQWGFEKTPEDFLKDEPFWNNAIVYSNHTPERINSYMNLKFTQLNIVQLAATGEFGEEWQTLSETVDIEGGIICPMLRAYRLFNSICETTTNSGCEDIFQSLIDSYEIILADATERNICISERITPGFELYYAPIPVDLSAPQ